MQATIKQTTSPTAANISGSVRATKNLTNLFISKILMHKGITVTPLFIDTIITTF